VAVTNYCKARPFEFSLQSERTAMGRLLGAIADRSVAESGFMLSAIVFYLNQNTVGSGFYDYAIKRIPPMLAKDPTERMRDEFLSQQLAGVIGFYGRHPPRD
jgi:hypothetical protein